MFRSSRVTTPESKLYRGDRVHVGFTVAGFRAFFRGLCLAVLSDVKRVYVMAPLGIGMSRYCCW